MTHLYAPTHQEGASMSRERTAVKRIREILRYKFDHDLSNERIALSLNVSKGTVYNILKRFSESKLSWPLNEDISDTQLEQSLYGPEKQELQCTTHQIDINYIESELTKPHVTVQCLFDEYQKNHTQGIGRSQFYQYVSKFLSHKPVMKIEHKGGDLLYVDYSGDGLEYVKRDTGECVAVELFVCAWGASSYSYADGTHTQSAEDFAASHDRALQYFGVVPHGLVPDNCKCAVSKPDRYDPVINPLYSKLAQHYNTTVIPARVRKPRDKAVVESNVLHVQRFILARLRNRTFYSLQEVNDALRIELDAFNDRPMKDYGNRSRRERFEELDKPYALKLPPQRFTLCRIKQDVRVAPNYHIRFEDHYYSVPHQYSRCCVDVYLSGALIEIYYNNQHLCRHLYSSRKYGYTTVKEHMPHEHQFVKGWSKAYFLAQGGKIGPSVMEVIKITLARHQHVQQGFNACMGILRLAQAYSAERLEKASERALFYNVAFGSHIKSILEQNLDQKPIIEPQRNQSSKDTTVHENVRGETYYQLELELKNA